jgi:Zn-dependent M28 family amino/carboxypeptidase
MNEENGLRGGKAYAADHASELANHIGAMETDGGADHPLGINIRGHPEIKNILEPIGKVLGETGAGILTKVEHGGADTSPMEASGVPTFTPIQDNRTYFHYHHTAADTLDKVDPRFLAENAAINVVFAYALANSEQPLPR